METRGSVRRSRKRPCAGQNSKFEFHFPPKIVTIPKWNYLYLIEVYNCEYKDHLCDLQRCRRLTSSAVRSPPVSSASFSNRDNILLLSFFLSSVSSGVLVITATSSSETGTSAVFGGSFVGGGFCDDDEAIELERLRVTGYLGLESPAYRQSSHKMYENDFCSIMIVRKCINIRRPVCNVWPLRISSETLLLWC